MSSIAHLVRRATPHRLALIAPQQSVSLTYGELDARARSLARGLSDVGFSAGSVAVADIPNTAENLVLQLALSNLGASVATVKDVAALDKLKETHDVRGAILADASSKLAEAAADLRVPPVVLDEDGIPGTPALLWSVLADREPLEDAAAASGDSLLGIYGGAALSHDAAIKLGEAAADRLQIDASDRVCVSVTLFHAFGIGTAATSALCREAAVVLPAVGGIRGCGDPKQRSSVTLDVMRSERATIVFADSHTLRALPVDAPDDLMLRGGVCKIGSGSDFLEDVTSVPPPPSGGEERSLRYGSATLVAMGKAK